MNPQTDLAVSGPTAQPVSSSAPEELALNGTPEAAATPEVLSNAPAQASPRAPEIDPLLLDADAVRVVLRLRQSGHEAYLVGGCVRDLLVGRQPKDFDIATSATPNEVRNLFRNCRLIGRRFRLAHVYFKGGKILEVSTFRASATEVEEPQPSEAAEGDMRTEATAEMAVADIQGVAEAAELAIKEPDAPEVEAEPEVKEEKDVFITQDNVFGTAIEDARRRDFTINGLFYDPASGRVTDHVRGLRDLALREIRTIGDPDVRLREDPVRLLRAVRFACKLNFEFEARTYAAMEAAVEDLPRCSAPRLLEETFRLIRGGVSSESLKLLCALDALKTLLPPVDTYLKGQDDEGRAEFFSFASALDRLVSQGEAFDDSMLLAGLLLPLSLDEPQAVGESDEGKPPSVSRAIETLLHELVRTARLPRRIAERCRMILFSMPTLAGERRRRGGLMSYRRHPLFVESLKVFEVWVAATGEHKEKLELWKSGQAPAPSPDAPGPSKRRRRRRRRGGPPEGAPGTVAAPSSEPTPSEG